MLIRSIENKPTELLIPEGAVEKALLKALAIVGVPFEPRQGKCYSFALPALDMMVTINRAKSIPPNLQKQDSTAVIGITGEDIAREYKLTNPQSFDISDTESWKRLPLETPPVQLLWMTTPNAKETFGELDRTSLEDWQRLTSGVVFASYPQIAADYLSVMKQLNLPVYEESTAVSPKKLPKSRIEKVSGKVEAQWWNTPSNYLIADLVEGGETMKANQLQEFAQLLPSVANILLTAIEKATVADLDRKKSLVSVLFEAQYKNRQAQTLSKEKVME